MNGLYTKKQVAELFQVSQNTIDNWRKSGKLKSFIINRSVRFEEAEVQRFIKEHKNGTDEK